MTSVRLASEEDYRWCQGVAKLHARNFYYSFWTLPKPKKMALCTIYAFCRHCDDAVDLGLTPEEASERLVVTRRAVAGAFVGRAEEPLFRALADVVREYSIPREIFEEHILGNEMDLTVHRYETMAELEVYCHRVASVVGLMCLPIFGCVSGESRDYAERLGQILQLTNIARDVKEDASRNRIYLPQEELRRFGVGEGEVLAGRMTPALAALIRNWRERIEEKERQLDAIPLAATERKQLLTAEIMRAIYARLRVEMALAGEDVMARRIRLPGMRKALLAMQVWWKN